MGKKPTIGFIAVSGVRCNDKELLAVGLNLPGFVERSKVIASLPSLGLLTLAGMTKDYNQGHPEGGYDYRYLEVDDLKDSHFEPGEFALVAISSFTARIKDAYELASRFRAVGVHVVLGGLHVTTQAQEAGAWGDTLVLGEAELSWPEFLADFAEGKAKKVYDGRQQSYDLSLSPMPAFELLEIEKYNRLTVQTQRGCPWRCGFCASSILLNPLYRNKPVDRVIAEIQRIKEIWPQPFIEFADDNTFVDKEYGKELMRALAPLGIKWFTETDLSVGDDEELLDLMKKAGCAQILIGLESPSREVLFGVNNWKQSQYTRYMENIKRIQSYGITVNGCFILGLDHTGPESFDQIFNFVQESGLFEVQITLLTPFPGTPLYQTLLTQGRILEPGAWERCTLFDINFQPDILSVQELKEGLLTLGQRIYDPQEVKTRRRRFFDQVLPQYAHAAL